MRLIGVVNTALLGATLLVFSCFLFSSHEEKCPPPLVRPEQKEIPKSPFAESDEFFLEIGTGILSLTWVPPQMLLPDLRQELLFGGKNARPDSLAGKSSFHVSLKGSQERNLVREGERSYLVYQGAFSSKEKRRSPSLPGETLSTSPQQLWGEVSPVTESFDKSSYAFSPGNQPTPLWFEIKSLSEQAVEVKVSMLDEKGVLVASPTELRSFQLQGQEPLKGNNTGWELGGHRVDTTLLVRQKARWAGPDLFLERHGGEEFAHVIGKDRIDFLENDSHYSCFISQGDFLVWKEKQWHVAQESEETQFLPLLFVKKIDEKIISFELWDAEGKGKVNLSLLRSKDHNIKPDLSQEIKFVGAKTWAQFIVECRLGGRMTLKLHDWLVLTEDGWKKLDSPEEIDAYVCHEISGPLFILDKMVKQNGRQVLIGHLFNSSRTEVEEVELTSSPNTSLANIYRHIPMAPPLPIPPSRLDIEGDDE